MPFYYNITILEVRESYGSKNYYKKSGISEGTTGPLERTKKKDGIATTKIEIAKKMRFFFFECKKKNETNDLLIEISIVLRGQCISSYGAAAPTNKKLFINATAVDYSSQLLIL